MLALLVLILFGALTAVFATQNTLTTTVGFGNYALSDIPLYLVVLASLFIGILVAWLVSLANGISAHFTRTDKSPSVTDKTTAELAKQVHDLEIENEHLKAQLRNEPQPRFFPHLRHKIST